MMNWVKFYKIKDHEKKVRKPWNGKKFEELLLKANTRISKDRAWTLIQFLDYALQKDGECIEMGVYKGASAYLIADRMKKNKKHKILFLLDTFKGTPYKSTGYKKDNEKRKGQYIVAGGIQKVKEHLREYEPLCQFIQGVIPKSFSTLPENTYFCFIHIHLNLYDSTYEALKFAYKYCIKDGIILIEDYGLTSCQGVKAAVDKFCKKHKIRLIELPTCQGVIIK
ncbi:MAG: hypothetical protein HFI78_00500 [Lachnospiraceae bacterium]|jgi:O-methyltransferase|nr:hypothetical protein [Lachnospiraceae bacterium]